MEQTVPARSHWTSRWAFILVTAGSAVGLGNLWRFPFMTGTQGGSAFVLVYLGCLIAVGLPLLMAEVMIGRRGRGNALDAIERVAVEAKASPRWGRLAWISLSCVFVVLSFYSVIAGWILEYAAQAAFTGFAGLTPEVAKEHFGALLGNPWRLAGWHTLFMAMTAGVVIAGVTGGIERANKLMMPALVAILIGLLVYGAIAADLGAAFRFMFRFEPERINTGVLVSALGQAFFTLGIGNGIMITYGSYLRRDTSIGRTACYVIVADTAIALMAGLAIFAIVFAQGLAPGAGPGLILQTLPVAFASMPGGHLIGTVFFILVVFAAWTSSISMLEPLVTLLVERTRMRRRQATLAATGAIWLLGILVCLSFNVGADVRLFGMEGLDFLDTLSAHMLMPAAGLSVAAIAGWVMSSASAKEELGLTDGQFALWRFAIRFVAPVAIVIVLLTHFMA